MYRDIKKVENIVFDNKDYVVYINSKGDKYIESKDGGFHFVFRKENGFTAKWGKTLDEDVSFNPFGEEIADIELTKICYGIRDKENKRKNCPFCYKSNTQKGDYMSFDTFKNIFDKIVVPKTLTQIAFGTDASLSEGANPDYWKIFEYCKNNGVTPNVTVADVDLETSEKIAKTFGAVAVSYYPLIDKNRCYDSVKNILDSCKKIGRKMDVNIHCLLSEETYKYVLELLDDVKKDERLKGINAIVFLSLKQKGRGIHFNKLEYEKFKHIIKRCFAEDIPFGLDSCTANKFINVLKEEKMENLIVYVESCESFGLFSMYVDCYGNYYPCSFMEREGEWEKGIDLKSIDNFVDEVWYSEKVCKEREKSLKQAECNGGCTSCPYYNI